MEISKPCLISVFDWVIPSNIQQTIALFISAPAYRPHIDPASLPLPPPVLPGSRPPVPLHYWELQKKSAQKFLSTEFLFGLNRQSKSIFSLQRLFPKVALYRRKLLCFEVPRGFWRLWKKAVVRSQIRVRWRGVKISKSCIVYRYFKHIKRKDVEFHDVTFILCHFQMENANEDPATASNFTATSSRSASEETVHIEHSEVRETIRRLQESMPSLNLLLNHIPFWANYWRECLSLSMSSMRHILNLEGCNI